MSCGFQLVAGTGGREFQLIGRRRLPAKRALPRRPLLDPLPNYLLVGFGSTFI